MSAHSRRKGKRGEYLARDMFRKWGFEARRGIQSAGEADLTHSIQGYHVEVKNDERLSIWAMLAQAERDSVAMHEKDPTPVLLKPLPDDPIVFFKRNGTKFYAALDAEVLLRLLRLEATYGEFKEINDARPE